MTPRRPRWPLLLSALLTFERRARLLWLSTLVLAFFVGRASSTCGGAEHAAVASNRPLPDGGVASDSPHAGRPGVADGGSRAEAIPLDAGWPGHDGSLRAVYRILPRRNVAPAMGNSVGVTHDGRRLWLLSSNEVQHVLYELDEATSTPLRSHPLPALIGAQGTSAHGIAWVDGAIWIAIAGSTNELVQVDPDTGRILRRLSAPTELGPTGLSFDGQRLWLSSTTGHVYRMSTQNGGIEQRFLAGSPEVRSQGVAHRAGEIWVAGLFEQMVVYSSRDGALLGAVTTQDGAHLPREDLGQLCFVGDELVVLSQRGLTYYRPERVAE
ncbi:YncE family protein [Sorangium sp. So ce861]|uniref:YncE family protein n=1 Tax=Sorangium sp. So ce861 TaxID=3133323 RepID=UPI003F633656